MANVLRSFRVTSVSRQTTQNPVNEFLGLQTGSCILCGQLAPAGSNREVQGDNFMDRNRWNIEED